MITTCILGAGHAGAGARAAQAPLLVLPCLHAALALAVWVVPMREGARHGLVLTQRMMRVTGRPADQIICLHARVCQKNTPRFCV